MKYSCVGLQGLNGGHLVVGFDAIDHIYYVPARKNFIIFKARRAQQLFSGVETAVHKPSYRQLYAREKALVENNRQSIQQLLTCLRYAIWTNWPLHHVICSRAKQPWAIF